MKKYIYLLIDEEKNVVAAYDRIDLINTLKPHIEKKLDVELTMEKVRVNVDLAHLDG